MSTKNNPGEFDCCANAEPDEPMFAFLARDKHAPEVVREWARAMERRQKGIHDIHETRISLKHELSRIQALEDRVDQHKEVINEQRERILRLESIVSMFATGFLLIDAAKLDKHQFLERCRLLADGKRDKSDDDS